jgi:hypothetical protein
MKRASQPLLVTSPMGAMHISMSGAQKSSMLSYNGIWADAMAMLRQNASLIVAIAGVFLFLPSLFIGYFLPPPHGGGEIPDIFVQLEAYMDQTWAWSLLANILNTIGAVAIYLLLLKPEGRTVGQTLAGALIYVPSCLLLYVLTSFALMIGFLLLIVPGAYLLGRIAIASPVLVAERRFNPLSAIAVSFERTKSNGWRIAGLLLLVLLVAFVVVMVMEGVFGSILILLGGREGLGPLFIALLNAALTASISTVFTALLAAIYRGLPASNNGI